MVDLNISSARLIPYRVRLTERTVPQPERVGRLVRLESRQGHVGWGDVAPLPGFSIESVDAVDAAWKGCEDLLCNRPWTCDPARLGESDTPSKLVSVRSLRFGLEQALIGLTAKIEARNPARLFAPDWNAPIRLAGLVTEIGEPAVSRAAELADRGYNALKIKVGRLAVRDEVDTVLAIRSHVGPRIALRLDANRAWTLDQALEFVKAIARTRPEFVEEPLADPDEARELQAKTGVPIALDESLLQIDPVEVEKWSFASHLVLKPTLLGGIESSEAFVTAGSRLGMTPVVSAAYESGIGISVLACLAGRWCPDGPAAGLDTYSRLETDILERKLPLGPAISSADLVFEPGRSILLSS